MDPRPLFEHRLGGAFGHVRDLHADVAACAGVRPEQLPEAMEDGDEPRGDGQSSAGCGKGNEPSLSERINAPSSDTSCSRQKPDGVGGGRWNIVGRRPRRRANSGAVGDRHCGVGHEAAAANEAGVEPPLRA